MKQSNQNGFTLIELVIVIVILGILAVTAAPKFLNIQGDARTSTVQGMEGALKGGISIVYSKALIQGKTAATGSLTDPAIDLVFGYPAATVNALNEIMDTDLVAAADTAPTNGADWEVTVTAASGTGTSAVIASAKIYPVGDFAGNSTDSVAAQDCYVEYTQATATTEATVTSETTGC